MGRGEGEQGRVQVTHVEQAYAHTDNTQRRGQSTVRRTRGHLNKLEGPVRPFVKRGREDVSLYII